MPSIKPATATFTTTCPVWHDTVEYCLSWWLHMSKNSQFLDHRPVVLAGMAPEFSKYVMEPLFLWLFRFEPATATSKASQDQWLGHGWAMAWHRKIRIPMIITEVLLDPVGQTGLSQWLSHVIETRYFCGFSDMCHFGPQLTMVPARMVPEISKCAWEPLFSRLPEC